MKVPPTGWAGRSAQCGAASLGRETCWRLALPPGEDIDVPRRSRPSKRRAAQPGPPSRPRSERRPCRRLFRARSRPRDRDGHLQGRSRRGSTSASRSLACSRLENGSGRAALVARDRRDGAWGWQALGARHRRPQPDASLIAPRHPNREEIRRETLQSKGTWSRMGDSRRDGQWRARANYSSR